MLTTIAVAALLAAAAGSAGPATAAPGSGSAQLILGHGHARRVLNRFLAPGALAPNPAARVTSPPRRGSAHVARNAGPGVQAALGALQRGGTITPQANQQYLAEYLSARRSLRHLTGTRRSELGGVLGNVEAIAASGGFIASRLPALFLTLQRNQQWWTTGPLLAGGQRVGFPGSDLVWEYYPGQGIEIQWLGTFGEANGYYQSGDNADLRRVLDEAVTLASARAGGVAWEYLFRFDGGAPPWTSGLSQGTAIQALARAWSRLHTAAYLNAAAQALGIFQAPPPDGVRVATAAGAHYLEYSYAPRERILNGFIQSLVGLYDYTKATRDPLGQQLFAAGDAEARVETPTYDTGAWSLYDQSSESDLSYHQLVIQFLQNLCSRTQQSPAPLGPAAARGAPNPGEIYCVTAQHFQSYLSVKPVLTLADATDPVGGRPGQLRYRLSKISSITVAVRRGPALVYLRRALVARGQHSSAFTPPARAGLYTVTVSATDLAGNSSSVQGALNVGAPSRPPRAKHH